MCNSSQASSYHFFPLFIFVREERKRVEANLLQVSREKTSLEARHRAQQDGHKLLLAKQSPEMTV